MRRQLEGSPSIASALRSAALLCAAVCVTLSCRQTDETSDPLVYTIGQSGTVSSLYGPVGRARRSANDPTPPEFYWHNSIGALDSLSGQNGKVVVLNFWATWCGPCKAEMPDLQAISQQYPADSVVVIGVAVDANGNVFQEASDYVHSNGVTYQIVTDSLFRLYNQFVPSDFAIPYTFLIAPDGHIAYYFVGQATKDEFIAKIEAIK